MDSELMKLNIVVTLRDDGDVEARCTDFDISVVAETYEKALADLWNALGAYLSHTAMDSLYAEGDNAMPYYGPSGGVI